MRYTENATPHTKVKYYRKLVCVCVYQFSIHCFIVIDNSTDRVTFLLLWSGESPWKLLYEKMFEMHFSNSNRIINECYFELMMVLTESKRMMYGVRCMSILCLFIFGILAWHNWESLFDFVGFIFRYSHLTFLFIDIFHICRSFQMQIWKAEKTKKYNWLEFYYLQPAYRMYTICHIPSLSKRCTWRQCNLCGL